MNNVLALLFFLLPVAAFSGWVLGRRRSERTSGARVNEKDGATKSAEPA